MLDLLSPFSVPPLFWPAFWQCLILFVGLVSGYHGFIAPVIQARRQKRQQAEQQAEQAQQQAQQQAAAYKQEVCDAYEKVAGVHNPGIFDPAHPGNPHAIKKLAQDAADALRPKLVRKYTEEGVPSMIDVENAISVHAWYGLLRRERARVHG